MKTTILSIGTLCLCQTICSADTLSGQVFIRTNVGVSVKLGLVDVEVFERESLRHSVIEKLKNAKPLIEYLRTASAELEAEYSASRGAGKTAAELRQIQREIADIEAMHDYLSSSVFALTSAPKPVAIGKTDADGSFSVDVPKGSYFVAARDKRVIGQTVEFYQWVISAEVMGLTRVTLANHNTSESGAAESMMKDPRNLVSLLLSSGELPTLESVTAFVETHKNARKAKAERVEAENKQMEEAARARNEQAARDDLVRRQNIELFKKNPRLASQMAAQKFPDIARAGTRLNAEYQSRFRKYKAEKPRYFDDLDWPIRLAEECDRDIRAGVAPR